MNATINVITLNDFFIRLRILFADWNVYLLAFIKLSYQEPVHIELQRFIKIWRKKGTLDYVIVFLTDAIQNTFLLVAAF